MAVEEIYVLCVDYNGGDYRKFVADNKDGAIEQKQVLLNLYGIHSPPLAA